MRVCAEISERISRHNVQLPGTTFRIGYAAESQEANQQGYSILSPDMAREMTSCWISDVPSKIVWLISDRPVRFEQRRDVRFRVRRIRPVVVGPTSCRDEVGMIFETIFEQRLLHEAKPIANR